MHFHQPFSGSDSFPRSRTEMSGRACEAGAAEATKEKIAQSAGSVVPSPGVAPQRAAARHGHEAAPVGLKWGGRIYF